MPKTLLRALVLAVSLPLTILRAWPQAAVRVIADNISYNVGDRVRLKVVYPNLHLSEPPGAGVHSPVEIARDLAATIRYAGESRAILDEVPIASSFLRSKSNYSTGYREVWKVPSEAKTGRYEVDLAERDPQSHQVVLNHRRVGSFAVHRKLVRIERIELDRTSYTSGDAVACRVTLKELSDHPLPALRVEFSDRHWPWTAPPPGREAPQVFPLSVALALAPGAKRELRSTRAAVAKAVDQPTVHQYAVVVWDRERKNIYDIAFSAPVIIRPPGVDLPKPYPNQYTYPELGSVNVSSYRDFYPPELNSSAIQFDRSRTMFASGSEATVRFAVLNPTDQPWRGVTIRASLRSLGSAEFANKVVMEKVDLAPRSSRLKQETPFALPSDGSGVFRAVVEVRDSSGQVLAANSLELGANPLPNSILIFCAHEDDETAHPGIIRAAVENHIPLQVVYFTSGDAGSCDRYYQHSCGPAEALNFGALRMEEARASLAHLGLSRENIHFLGLPDGGLGQIWSNHVEPSNPYLSVLLACDHAPFEGLARPNLPYARKSVVAMVKEFIKRFQPEVIYTGHPDERHVDHRANNWLVVKALQELLREGTVSGSLTLLVDQVYGAGPQKRAPYRYEKHVLHVSGEVSARAQEARWFYQSQGGNRAQGNLHTYHQLPRTEVHWQVLDWKDHEGWNGKD